MAYTAPTTRAASDLIGASDWNTDLVDNITYLADTHPRVRCTRSAVQAIPDSATTTVLWTAETYDNASMHSLVSNTGRLTAPVAGQYIFTGFIEYAVNATGARLFILSLNGSAVASAKDTGDGTYTSGIPFSYMTYLSATEYFEVVAFQTSGGALDVTTKSYAALTWMGV